MMWIKCTVKVLTVARIVYKFPEAAAYILDRYNENPDGVIKLVSGAIIPLAYAAAAIVHTLLSGCFQILVEIRSLDALDEFWNSYKAGDMKENLEKVIVTDDLRSLAKHELRRIAQEEGKAPDDVKDVFITLEISEDDYRKTRDYLLESALRNDVGASSLASMAISTPSSSPPPAEALTAEATATLLSPPLSKRGLHETSIEGEEKTVDAKRGLHETSIDGEEKTVEAIAIRGLRETSIDGKEKTVDAIAIRGLYNMSIRRLDDKLDRMAEHLGAMVKLQYEEKGMAEHLRAMGDLKNEMKGIAAQLLATSEPFKNESKFILLDRKGMISINGAVKILTAGGLAVAWAAGSYYLLRRHRDDPEKIKKLVTVAIIPSLVATGSLMRTIHDW